MVSRAACLLLAACLVSNVTSTFLSHKAAEAFEAFLIEHRREYTQGSEEYDMRKALFLERFATIHAHNEKPGMLWKEAVSHFSDRTHAERKAVLGYKRRASRERGAGLLQVSNASKEALPASKDWLHLKSAMHVRDQGSCGSCWAVTTTSTLEAHYEIYSAKGGPVRSFSAQQTLECTPNPQSCGGDGGCGGATVELGMKYILENGVGTDNDVPYKGENAKCKQPAANAAAYTSEKIVEPAAAAAAAAPAVTAPNDQFTVLAGVAPAQHGGGAFGLVGYHMLDRNKDFPLAQAVANYGPVAISAGAAGWFGYSKGVFHGCGKDAEIDHAITLFGYGSDPTLNNVKYWTIRNSWGKGWGEGGFIRMIRVEDKDGEKRADCGTDSDPQEGTTCKTGSNNPATVEVCGQCGMLYDSVVPYFRGSPGHDSLMQSSAYEIDGLARLMRAKKHEQ